MFYHWSGDEDPDRAPNRAPGRRHRPPRASLGPCRGPPRQRPPGRDVDPRRGRPRAGPRACAGTPAGCWGGLDRLRRPRCDPGTRRPGSRGECDAPWRWVERQDDARPADRRGGPAARRDRRLPGLGALLRSAGSRRSGCRPGLDPRPPGDRRDRGPATRWRAPERTGSGPARGRPARPPAAGTRSTSAPPDRPRATGRHPTRLPGTSRSRPSAPWCIGRDGRGGVGAGAPCLDLPRPRRGRAAHARHRRPQPLRSAGATGRAGDPLRRRGRPGAQRGPCPRYRSAGDDGAADAATGADQAIRDAWAAGGAGDAGADQADGDAGDAGDRAPSDRQPPDRACQPQPP